MEKKEIIKKVFENIKSEINKEAMLDVEDKLYDLMCTMDKLKHIAYNLDKKYDISNPDVSDKTFAYNRNELATEVWIMSDYVSAVSDIVDYLVEVV